MIPEFEISRQGRELIDGDGDLGAVWEPLVIAGKPLRNRASCSPMSTNMGARDGGVSDDIIHFYKTMARSGVGLVTVGGTSVSKEGACSANGMHIGSPELEPGLTQLATVIRDAGALSSIQIMHAGAQGNTHYTGEPVLGPSPYLVPDIGILARELTIGEIHRIEEEFADGILSALHCGFDFAELHVAHGYLLHEFLSPFFNRRDDEYGGSPENRIRIFSNIFGMIDAREPGALERVGARISGHDFQDDGLTIKRNRPLVELFNDHKTAYWVVSAGVYETAPKKYVAMKKGDYGRYAEELRTMTSAPVVGQGGIRSIRQGGALIRSGQADIFGMAQALLADPLILQKTLAGEGGGVAECIECGRCKYLKRVDLTFDCLVKEGYHPPDMDALACRVSPEGIARETPDRPLDLPRRRRIHPVGHV